MDRGNKVILYSMVASLRRCVCGTAHEESVMLLRVATTSRPSLATPPVMGARFMTSLKLQAARCVLACPPRPLCRPYLLTCFAFGFLRVMCTAGSDGSQQSTTATDAEQKAVAMTLSKVLGGEH